MINERSICKQCKSEFLLKRSDQKFCSGRCRSRYHNKKSPENSTVIKEINRELLKDYRILGDVLAEQEEVQVSRMYLLKKGFSFEKQTHSENWRDSNQNYIGLYDLCYAKDNNDNFMIRRL